MAGRTSLPDLVVESGATIEFGGLTFSVRDVGPAESDADSLWMIDRTTVFAGDVAYNGMHAYLADGRTKEWLAGARPVGDRARRRRRALRRSRRAGRQRATADSAGVCRDVPRLPSAAAAGLDPAARHDTVTARMGELVADDRLRFLMELSIEPVAAALTGERTT